MEPVAAAFGTGRTATVAETSARILLDLLGWQGQLLRSSELPARPGRSQRLADLTAAAGARLYLCGTGGMKYLDETPFADQAITVVPFRPPTTSIWSSGRQISALWALATLIPAALTERLRAVGAAQTALETAAWARSDGSPSQAGPASSDRIRVIVKSCGWWLGWCGRRPVSVPRLQEFLDPGNGVLGSCVRVTAHAE